MLSLGLTGGIATGKSTVSLLMKELDSQIVIFDADQCVRSLYQDAIVLRNIKEEFGENILCHDGSLNRDVMRSIVFSDKKAREKLQNITHPLVRKECLAKQAEALQDEVTSLFIADVPLLFEGGFDFGQSANLVVALSRETQVKRLKMRSGFDDATVFAILEAQLPIQHKVNCADIVLWNEGPIPILKKQIQRLIQQIT